MLSRVGLTAARTARTVQPRVIVATQRAGFQTNKFTPVTVTLQKKQQPVFVSRRPLHSSPSTNSNSNEPKKNPFSDLQVDPSKIIQVSNELVAKLQAASTEQLYHWTSYGLAGLAPVALILSPSFLNFPVDFALGLIIPVHMHIGLVQVAEDYVPRPQQSLARFILAVLTVLSGIGLLKINLCGKGITESVKSIWREPKEPKRIQ